MTMHPAGINQGLPLEREHEGWLTERMHEYFEQLGIDAKIWAVSPREEAEWPADENLLVDRKWFSLQFKRPYRKPDEEDMGMIQWRLEQAQFELIKKYSHIYYLLPTTTNRAWRKVSLHHCLLWRPTDKASYKSCVWYTKEKAGPGNSWQRKLERYSSTYRWGAFTERFLSCEFGNKGEGSTGEEVMNALQQWTKVSSESPDSVLFMIGVESR